MSRRTDDIMASVRTSVSERLRGVAGNAAILGVVALLAITVWAALLAGLVALLAPLWGTALALFFVALLVAVIALILLAIVQWRTRQQRLRAELRQAETRRKGQAALLAALPGLLRHRSGALVVVSGLAIGALIVAALQADDEE
ncbi:hypothetical protein MUY35_16910 [Aliiroseovarius sp. S1339]|uniref:hypothetical protein n=1 Tax=Aliiroseovarius sp. S1339 TaxID=2936990 RepID=UPI0020BE4C6C|nr:hypothetical protein [Aliiroseovarius sp. S1339]MCK8465543.1 hypothetical protein [Aliiroseovarius sp. S1339]